MEPYNPKVAVHVAMDAAMRDPETIQALKELKIKKRERGRAKRARRSARKRAAADSQPTHSSNDMNSDDIGRVFSMTKKRQSRVEKKPRARKTRNTVTDDLAELLATTSFATEVTPGRKGIAARGWMRRIDRKLVHEKRTHAKREEHSEKRLHLENSQQTIVDGRNASDADLENRELMICDEL